MGITCVKISYVKQKRIDEAISTKKRKIAVKKFTVANKKVFEF